MDSLNIPLFRNGQIDPNSVDILFSKQTRENDQQQQIYLNNRQNFVSTMYNNTYTYPPYSYLISTKQKTNNKNSMRARRNRKAHMRNNGLNNRAGPSGSRNERNGHRIKANKTGQHSRNNAAELNNQPYSLNDPLGVSEEEGSTTDGGVESDQKIIKGTLKCKFAKR